MWARGLVPINARHGNHVGVTDVLGRPAVAIHYCFARGLGGVVSVRAGPSFGSHAYRAVRMNPRLSDVRQGAPSENRISVRPDAFVRTDFWLVRKSTWEA